MLEKMLIFIYLLTLIFDLYYALRVNYRVTNLEPTRWTKMARRMTIVSSFIPFYNVYHLLGLTGIMELTDEEIRETLKEIDGEC